MPPFGENENCLSAKPRGKNAFRKSESFGEIQTQAGSKTPPTRAAEGLKTRNFCKYLSKASFSNLARSLFNFASNKTANLNVSIPERDWKLELVEHVL